MEKYYDASIEKIKEKEDGAIVTYKISKKIKNELFFNF